VGTGGARTEQPEQRRTGSETQRGATLSDEAFPGTAALFADLETKDVEALLFDAAYYLDRYPDVRTNGIDPLEHYRGWGAFEARDPSPYFNPSWYLQHNPDVAKAGLSPLQHYARFGAQEMRQPHPRFDPLFYVAQIPESAPNPLLFHLAIGRALGLPTERHFDVENCLPAKTAPPRSPRDLAVDIVIPVFRGFEDTRRCLHSLLRDPQSVAGVDADHPALRIVVVDDASPEPRLSRYLRRLATRGLITLIKNERNLGFVASVNRGIQHAGARDVVLLNSDTEVPSGWLQRLAAHAYAHPNVATVSPFSNNATICSYPAIDGGPIPFGASLASIDAACRKANAGRSIRVPTTVGFCLYLRGDAYAELGLFDADTFGRGYGEESDYCMRASAAGWQHRLACDIFVYHAGSVSFGAGAPELSGNADLLDRRWPSYRPLVAVHIRLDEGAPFRLATTLQFFATNGLPTILMVKHAHDGGVGQHIRDLAEACVGQANILLLSSILESPGLRLGAPAAVGHPEITLPAKNLEATIFRLLRHVGIARVHVHHWRGLGLNLRRMIAVLAVPFDVTVHDWFAICPRVNLLPRRDAIYCGEPGPEVCNACLHQGEPTEAHDISAWRSETAWLFRLADRVFCGTEDTRRRLDRYGLADRAVIAPLELAPVPAARQTASVSSRPEAPVRVAILGMLADHKGAPLVMEVAERSPPGSLAITLIGEAERPLARHFAHLIAETGRYRPKALPALIARLDPQVIWFPAPWPETWSLTLTAAIASGRPIVATDLGAFRERLATYPEALLLHPGANAEEWSAGLFTAAKSRTAPTIPPVQRVAQFYPASYLLPFKTQPSQPRRRGSRPGVQDLRRPGRTAVILVPERLDEGDLLSPCTYIRTLLPLAHPQAGEGIDITLATADEALGLTADLIVTQRYAVPDPRAAKSLIAHVRESGGKLLFDLDDDLLNLPLEHSEINRLAPKALVVETLVRGADGVQVSTSELASRLAQVARPGALVIVPNGLDERLWSTAPPPEHAEGGPSFAAAGVTGRVTRILYMGTATHGADLGLILPALGRLKATFAEQISIELVGIVGAVDLPPFVKRAEVPHRAGLSYPAFVAWLTAQQSQRPWAIGIAPLADNDFNRCKSSIKLLDYGALGLATVASDMPAYQAADGTALPGTLLAADEAAWFHALSKLIRQPARRLELAKAGRASLLGQHSLAAQSATRRAILAEAAAARSDRPAAPTTIAMAAVRR
jgi:GT2 family glycosyltransferase/glycosyltransferase involved in cell wall biosynthesis